MIVLSRRLPDPLNTYNEKYEDLIVDKVNGEKIQTLKEMKDLISQLEDEFLVIEFQNEVTPIVLKAKSLYDADKRIKERYNINELEYLKD